MKQQIKFVEIPTMDFKRAVKFYETVLNTQLNICYSCETEKMALFFDFSVKPPLALSWSPDFHPSKNGVLIHLSVDNIEITLEAIQANGGAIVRPKTKIEAEGMGYFALFSDSEGNTLGLYADQ